MKARRPFVYTAVSALLCGSFAAGSLYAAVKLTPEPLAAGYDESTDPANTYTLPGTTTWYEGGSEGGFTEETTTEPAAGESEEKLVTTIVTTTMTDEGPPAASVINASGICGPKAKYIYDGAYSMLTITGSGKIYAPDQWSIPSNFNLSMVERIQIGYGITEICDNVFSGCANLCYVELPKSLESIGACAFKDCTMLSDVEIPDSVTEIGKNAFYGCSNLTCVTMPQKLELVDTGLFRNCCMLEDIQLPNKVKCVSEYAFSGCRSLAEIRIPDSVNKICSNAFQGCSSLSKLTLPYNLRSTGNGMFTGCTSLKELTVLNPDSQFSEESKMTGCVLRGYNSSTAQSLAQEKGLVFESLGDIPVPSPTLGDYNGDGSADIIDAQQVLIYYAEEEPYALSQADFRAADTDRNGAITALDAQNIMRYYLLNDLMEQPTQWSQIIRVEE